MTHYSDHWVSHTRPPIPATEPHPTGFQYRWETVSWPDYYAYVWEPEPHQYDLVVLAPKVAVRWEWRWP